MDVNGAAFVLDYQICFDDSMISCFHISLKCQYKTQIIWVHLEDQGDLVFCWLTSPFNPPLLHCLAHCWPVDSFALMIFIGLAADPKVQYLLSKILHGIGKPNLPRIVVDRKNKKGQNWSFPSEGDYYHCHIRSLLSEWRHVSTFLAGLKKKLVAVDRGD